MRILVLNPYLKQGYSGPTVLMSRLFGEISQSPGYKVTVLGPSLPDNPDPRLDYVTLPIPDVRSAKGQVAWSIRTLLWLLFRRKSYDVVHVHGTYLFSMIPVLILILCSKPYVLLPVGADGDLRAGSRLSRLPFVRRIRKTVVRRATVGYALSSANQAEFLSWGLPSSSVTRLNNVASSDFFERDTSSTTDEPTLIFIGKLYPLKRPEVILEALAELRTTDWPGATALFVGPYADDQYRDHFEELIRKLGLTSAVSVTGFVHDVAPAIRSKRGIFVLLSMREGLPGALVETMALGMPSVVTAVGAMGEVVEASKSGYIINPDPSELAASARAIWSDPHVWFCLSENARQYALTNYSPSSAARMYLEPLMGAWKAK